MISLRRIEEKDAPFMYECMHDEDIQKSFKKKMNESTLEDVTRFCKSAEIPEIIRDGDSLHFAIVESDNDEYLGTISLKEIDIHNKSAEYAIITRKKAHGKGIAYQATNLVLKKAFHEYGLHRVYLNVFSDNEKAIRLYERSGFVFEGEFREHFYIDGQYKNWKWYGILSEDFDKMNN